ncbi:MAG: pitrilysin family protein [Bacteroidota bacterium]
MKKITLFILVFNIMIVGINGQASRKYPSKSTKVYKKSAPKPSAEHSQNRIKFTEYDLPNGLHVILHQDNSTPLVATTVMYHVGSKNEKPGRSGFAHFFEHLLFEGSENIKRGEYSKIVKANGGQLNANTSLDRTFYYEILPSNKLELGLYLESERLLHAKIDEEGVKTQREVVKEEKRQRIDNQPYGTFLQEILSHSYKVHPYKISPIGTMEDLNAAKIDEFIEFYHDYYVPSNAILSVAGDIQIDETKKLITKYFGEIPKNKKPIYRPTIVEPQQTAEVRDIIYDNIQLPAVMMGFHVPAQGTEDYYALNMLNTLLAGGSSSRFNKELVDKQQKAVATGAIPLTVEDPGLVICYGIGNMGVKAEDLEKAIEVEIERVKAEEISDQEYQKLLNQTESEFVNSNATVAGIAESLANYKMYFGNANLINTEIEKFNQVTKEDIKRVANKYLTKENRVTLHYLPKSMEPKK